MHFCWHIDFVNEYPIFLDKSTRDNVWKWFIVFSYIIAQIKQNFKLFKHFFIYFLNALWQWTVNNYLVWIFCTVNILVLSWIIMKLESFKFKWTAESFQKLDTCFSSVFCNHAILALCKTIFIYDPWKFSFRLFSVSMGFQGYRC